MRARGKCSETVDRLIQFGGGGSGGRSIERGVPGGGCGGRRPPGPDRLRTKLKSEVPLNILGMNGNLSVNT